MDFDLDVSCEDNIHFVQVYMKKKAARSYVLFGGEEECCLVMQIGECAPVRELDEFRDTIVFGTMFDGLRRGIALALDGTVCFFTTDCHVPCTYVEIYPDIKKIEQRPEVVHKETMCEQSCIVYSTETGNVYCAGDGKVRCVVKSSDVVWFGVYGDCIYAVTATNAIRKIECRSGTKPRLVKTVEAFSDRREITCIVAVGACDVVLYGKDTRARTDMDGTIRWETRGEFSVPEEYIKHGDQIVAIEDDTQISVLEIESGRTEKKSLGRPVEKYTTVLEIDADTLLFGTSDGHVYFVDTAEWRICSEYSLEECIYAAAKAPNGAVVSAGPRLVYCRAEEKAPTAREKAPAKEKAPTAREKEAGVAADIPLRRMPKRKTYVAGEESSSDGSG